MAAAAAQVALNDMTEVQTVLTFIDLDDNVDALAGTRPTQEFAELTGVASMEDFYDLDPRNSEQIINRYNKSGNSHFELNMIHQSKLEMLLEWVRDRKRQGLPSDTADLSLAEMRSAHERAAQNKNRKDTDAPKIPKFNAKDFPNWDIGLLNSLSVMPSTAIVPMSYVARPVKPAGWTIDDAVA